MSASSCVVICIVIVLVDFVYAWAHISRSYWLDYSSIPFHQLPQDLESDYGAVVKELGAGTSGSVLLVLRHADNATIAVKRFRRPAACQYNVLSQQIKLEYHLGTLLNGYPGITQSLKLLLEDSSSTWFLATEFCPRSLTKERSSTGSESLTDTFREMSRKTSFC